MFDEKELMAMLEKKVTLGDFRRATEKLKDDVTLSFMFREGFPTDEGKDYLFSTHTISMISSEAEATSKFDPEKVSEVILTGVLPPEEFGDEGDCEEDCDCEEGECCDSCDCEEEIEEDPSKLN